VLWLHDLILRAGDAAATSMIPSDLAPTSALTTVSSNEETLPPYASARLRTRRPRALADAWLGRGLRALRRSRHQRACRGRPPVSRRESAGGGAS
jgi:hypothetical protein